MGVRRGARERPLARLERQQPRRSRRRRDQPIELFGVDDVVAVALLGQEQLAVGGEVLVARLAGDQRVEVRQRAVRLGAQDAPEALGLFLARAERARNLDGDVGVGQVDREVGDLRDDQQPDLAAREKRRRASRARGWWSCR